MTKKTKAKDKQRAETIDKYTEDYNQMQAIVVKHLTAMFKDIEQANPKDLQKAYLATFIASSHCSAAYQDFVPESLRKSLDEHLSMAKEEARLLQNQVGRMH